MSWFEGRCIEESRRQETAHRSEFVADEVSMPRIGRWEDDLCPTYEISESSTV